MKIRRVFVSGGSGFLGNHLVSALQSKEVDVIAPSHSDWDLLKDELPDQAFDRIFHLAGVSSIIESWQDPVKYFKINSYGTAKLLNEAYLRRIEFVYVSAYVYGQPEQLPVQENHPVRPNNPYAVSKVQAENFCRFYAESFHLPVAVVRPFNIFGPGSPSYLLIPSMLKQLLDPLIPAVVVEDAEPKRDFIYVKDVVSAVMAVTPDKTCPIFNIGSGQSYSVADIYSFLVAATGIEKPFVSKGNRRASELMNVIADTTALRSATGWEAKFTLPEGLIELARLN